MMYNVVSSDSVADDITGLMICAMLSTSPLFCGIIESIDKNKWPPARLLACGSLR